MPAADCCQPPSRRLQCCQLPRTGPAAGQWRPNHTGQDDDDDGRDRRGKGLPPGSDSVRVAAAGRTGDVEDDSECRPLICPHSPHLNKELHESSETSAGHLRHFYRHNDTGANLKRWRTSRWRESKN